MIQESPKAIKDSTRSSELSASVLDKLRTCCNRQRPTLRPSIQNVVQPHLIETVIVGAAVKHTGLTSLLNKFELATGNLSKKKEFNILLDIVEETFFKVDSLVRQLQAMAELEKKWWQDLMDICKDGVQPSAAFFNDYHLQEVGNKRWFQNLFYLSSLTKNILWYFRIRRRNLSCCVTWRQFSLIPSILKNLSAN